MRAFWYVVAAVFVLFALAGCSGTASASKPAKPNDGIDCGSITSEAVKGSADRNDPTMLLKVRDPKIDVDHRETVQLPTDDSERLILSCIGRGVWSDTTMTMVRVKASVDADGQVFISWRAY